MNPLCSSSGNVKCQGFVNESISAGFTVRGEGNSNLGYQMDNGGIQVIFQNIFGFNPASHSVGTVDIFPEIKAAEVRDQPLHLGLKFRMSVTVPLLLRTASSD